MSERTERFILLFLVTLLLLGLGLVQFRRQRPSFTLQVLSEEAPTAVPQKTFLLNSATQEELERLPGIGPGLAKRIVQTRNQQGSFRRLEELLAVKGIGQSRYGQISPYLRIDDTSLAPKQRQMVK